MNRRILRLLTPIAIVLSVTACAANHAQQNDNANTQNGAAAGAEEGSSFERAVVLKDAKNEFEGVSAEHEWIKAHYPGWRWDSQYLLNREGRVYDMIEISNGGEKREIYFDITDWFGKLD